jgi:hypothetical protein
MEIGISRPGQSREPINNDFLFWLKARRWPGYTVLKFSVLTAAGAGNLRAADIVTGRLAGLQITLLLNWVQHFAKPFKKNSNHFLKSKHSYAVISSRYIPYFSRCNRLIGYP